MQYLQTMLTSLFNGIGSIIVAVVILALAFVVSGVVKSLVLKLMDKTKLGEIAAKLDTEGKPGSAKEFIGKLVYLLVFLLFVPGIFSALGLSSIAAPITNVLSIIWGYVPNVLAAAIVLIVGNLVAKLVRQLLIPVLNKLNIDRFQEKAGIEVSGSDKLSATIAYIVYVLILIPTVIMALDVLDISVISVPAVSMLNTIIGFIPNLVIGLVIIVIGCMIAKLAAQIVTKLIAASGLDAKLQALMDTEKFVLSKAVSMAVYAVIVIFFVVEGLNVLHLAVLTQIGSVIISYMPAVLSAVLILAASMIISTMAEKALVKNGFQAYGVIAKCAIITVGAFMILSQLGIASNIVNSAFVLILAALAVAFAIAFGVGGREFASHMLKKLEDKTEESSKEE